jgi:molecular chaperone DnaK (HSP70)
MHVGAVPDDQTGAIRCKQYFVHSSLAGVNGSIYHSSKYAKLTDEEWGKMLEEATKLRLDEIAKVVATLDEQNALS